MQVQRPINDQITTQVSKSLFFLLLLLISNWASADTTFTLTHNKQNLSFKTSSVCQNADLQIFGVSPKVEKLLWKYNGQSFKSNYTPSLIQTVAGTTVEGNNDDEFRYPSGIAVDATGNIYIADQFNHRVQKWIPGAKQGITVAGGRGQGNASDQLDYPMGVAIDKEGNLYVSDAANQRIQKFSPSNPYGITVAGGNGRGPKANQFNMPFGICLDAEGNIYVADNYNHRIQKWVPGATEGITVAGGKQAGSNADQLRYPSSVKVDAEGNIYIADAANDRVQLWEKNAKEGITVAGGKRGTGADQLYFPTDIAINQNGDLFIADETNQRIQRWSKGAKQGVTIAGGNGLGKGMNQFSYPYGLFIDTDDNIYVADQYNHRVQLFRNPEASISYQISLKATRPGKYEAELVYRDGHIETMNEIEIHENPVAAPIETVTNFCTGNEYQLKHSYQGGRWTVSESAIATIDQQGVLKTLASGKVMVTYQIKTNAGCEASVSSALNIAATPRLPKIEMVPSLVQQSANTVLSTPQLCEGSSVDLKPMTGNGYWSVSDSSIASIRQHTLYGKNAGTVTVQYTLQENGCIATEKTQFAVAVAPAPIEIHGYKKVVAGQTIRLTPEISGGVWASEKDTYLDIDAAGYIRGIEPGVTEVVYQKMNAFGCVAKGTASISVQPQVPIVQDATYDSKKYASSINIEQQVKALSNASLQFYTSAAANQSAIQPIVLNQVGTQTIWVAQIVNGVASQRVPFKVTIQTSPIFAAKDQQLNIKVMGNPATQFFTVQLNSNTTQQPITMKVVDAQGRLIEQKNQLQANSTVQFGHTYAAGQYFVEYTQGGQRMVVSLLKLGAGNQPVRTSSYTSALY
jgi:sugar lactone lactonase YvrE